VPLAAWSQALPATAADIQAGYRPVPASHLACSQSCHRAQAPDERDARGRAAGIVSQLGATVLPRAVSSVAHDHADELPEVNRALPGSSAAQKGRPPSESP
jgi:hypothetical protein